MKFRNRKKPFIGMLVWLLLFSMTAAGFPAAVYGSKLESLSATEAAQTPGKETVYTPWNDFKPSSAAITIRYVHTPVSDSTMWRGDGIQLAFSPDGTYGPEYGINYMDGQAHVWQFSEGKATAGTALIEAAAVYEVRMPRSTIYTGKPETDVLPFTMLFNDNDGAGRRGWMEWTAGIGKAKSTASHARPAGQWRR